MLTITQPAKIVIHGETKEYRRNARRDVLLACNLMYFGDGRIIPVIFLFLALEEAEDVQGNKRKVCCGSSAALN